MGVGEPAPPPRKSAGLGLAAVLLQFEESQEQVSQRGHDKSARAPADSGSVFPQADVPTVMGAVFTGCPVAPDALEQLQGAVLLGGGTGAVETVFFGLFDYFAGTQFLTLAPYGQELPASAQAGLFGAKANPLNAPAHQTPVLFEPAGVVFRGKKNAAAAGFAPAPGCRSDCL